jgi:hypothetical protein
MIRSGGGLMALGAALQLQRQQGALGDGPPGMLFKLGANGLGADDRKAPIVERDAFRKDLGAVAVGAAPNRIPTNPPG